VEKKTVGRSAGQSKGIFDTTRQKIDGTRSLKSSRREDRKTVEKDRHEEARRSIKKQREEKIPGI